MRRPHLIPGSSHPITVTPTPGRVVARVGDQVVADSTNALTLQEAAYPAVQYVPMADVNAELLHRTETSTYCPYKGDAAYYSLSVDGTDLTDVLWTYESPYPAVAEIAGHVAFYADKVQVEVSAG